MDVMFASPMKSVSLILTSDLFFSTSTPWLVPIQVMFRLSFLKQLTRYFFTVSPLTVICPRCLPSYKNNRLSFPMITLLLSSTEIKRICPFRKFSVSLPSIFENFFPLKTHKAPCSPPIHKLPLESSVTAEMIWLHKPSFCSYTLKEVPSKRFIPPPAVRSHK